MTKQKQSAYLDAMGITQWVERTPAALPEPTPLQVQLDPQPQVEVETSPEPVLEVEVNTPPDATPAHSLESMDWDTLRFTASSCCRCGLSESRTQAVFGTGDKQANWMIIGEAPGENEDLQGEPFVGRSGLLLTNMLNAIGLSRENAYIANIVKCRPPQNRDPHKNEISSCEGFLSRQVQLLQPKIILVVSRIAVQHILETQAPVGSLRGKVHKFPGTDIPMIVTYHPAYLLRRPSEKRKTWEDLKLAMREFNLVNQ